MSHTPTPYRKGTDYGGIVADTPSENVDKRRIDEGHLKAYGGYLVAESCSPEDADEADLRVSWLLCEAHWGW